MPTPCSISPGTHGAGVGEARRKEKLRTSGSAASQSAISAPPHNLGRLLSPLRAQLLFTGLFLPNLESQPFPGAVHGRPRPGSRPQRKSVQPLFSIVLNSFSAGLLTQLAPTLPPLPQPGFRASLSLNSLPSGRPLSRLLFPLKLRPRPFKTE